MKHFKVSALKRRPGKRAASSNFEEAEVVKGAFSFVYEALPLSLEFSTNYNGINWENKDL